MFELCGMMHPPAKTAQKKINALRQQSVRPTKIRKHPMAGCSTSWPSM
jgi:hypothetical protein